MARPMSLMIEDWMPFGWLIEEKQARAHHQPAGTPAHPIQRIAAIAPPALISALSGEASRRGVVLEDANVTRM